MTDYLVAKGAPFTAEQGKTYGKRLASIEKKNRVLTPQLVLEDARDPRSPLHAAFEWNDRKAAETQRLERAADIIRAIRVVVRVSEDQQAKPRAFMLVRNAKDDAPAEYASIDRVMKDPGLSNEVLRRLRLDLVSTQGRYDTYFELFTRLQPLSAALKEGVRIVDEIIADEHVQT